MHRHQGRPEQELGDEVAVRHRVEAVEGEGAELQVLRERRAVEALVFWGAGGCLGVGGGS